MPEAQGWVKSSFSGVFGQTHDALDIARFAIVKFGQKLLQLVFQPIELGLRHGFIHLDRIFHTRNSCVIHLASCYRSSNCATSSYRWARKACARSPRSSE